MKCLKLNDLHVAVDGNSMPAVSLFDVSENHGHDNMEMQQYLLDTTAQLPELKILHVSVLNPTHSNIDPSNFKPSEGLRYVGELEFACRKYVLEWDRGRPVRYRSVQV
jgi:hypothetical protein